MLTRLILICCANAWRSPGVTRWPRERQCGFLQNLAPRGPYKAFTALEECSERRDARAARCRREAFTALEQCSERRDARAARCREALTALEECSERRDARSTRCRRKSSETRSWASRLESLEDLDAPSSEAWHLECLEGLEYVIAASSETWHLEGLARPSRPPYVRPNHVPPSVL